MKPVNKRIRVLFNAEQRLNKTYQILHGGVNSI